MITNLINKLGANKKMIFAKSGKVVTINCFDDFFVVYSDFQKSAKKYNNNQLDTIISKIESIGGRLIETYNYK